MDRETTEIKIGSHSYRVKTYATAREANAIQQAYFKGAKLEVVGDQPKLSEFNPGVQFEVQQEMVRQMVVSLEGKTDGIVEFVTNELPNHEFLELAQALDEIVAKKKK